jgi:hypothetical protein
MEGKIQWRKATGMREATVSDAKSTIENEQWLDCATGQSAVDMVLKD